ncbi:MAG: U32 family peptidase [Oscillospiraceae bacterium]
MEQITKTELLSPVGDMERLKYAIAYGADAVYLGADKFGMRAAPKNFTDTELALAVKYAHERNVKVYLTLNAVPSNEEIASLPDFVRIARECGIDAFIVADLGVLAIVKKFAPETDIHFSTQVGIANYMAANAAYDLGAKRVVLARELTLNDIAIIRDNTPDDLELEAFVHGAMCMSFSGRCLLSHYMTGRDANKGECAQPCRWKFKITDEKNRQYDIGEEDGGSYILNANDLCTAPFIDQIIKAGINSLKIEGRAKSFYYVASVTSAYRKAVDAYLTGKEPFLCPEDVLEELTRTSHRKYSTGFFFGKDGAVQNTDFGGYIREWDVMGVVEDYNDGIATCTQRGKFFLGQELEALTPAGKLFSFTPAFLWDKDNEEIESTPHAMMEFKIPCDEELPQYTLLRRKA